MRTIKRKVKSMELHTEKKSRFNGIDNVRLSKTVLEPSEEIAILIERFGKEKVAEHIEEIVIYSLKQWKQHLFNFISEEANYYYGKKNASFLFITKYIMDCYDLCELDLKEEIEKCEKNKDFFEKYKNKHLEKES